MKKLSLLLVIALILSLAFTSFAFAAVPNEEEISPQNIIGCVYSFIADSNTAATADVYAQSSTVATYITSTITLQSSSNGGSTYTDVAGVDPETITVYSQSYIDHECTFPITRTGDYRIKIAITDKVGSTVLTKYYYEELVR